MHLRRLLTVAAVATIAGFGVVVMAASSDDPALPEPITLPVTINVSTTTAPRPTTTTSTTTTIVPAATTSIRPRRTTVAGTTTTDAVRRCCV